MYNHCCNGKAISITHSECVSIDLGVQHAPIVTCGLSASTIFLSIISKNETFLGEKKFTAQLGHHQAETCSLVDAF